MSLRKMSRLEAVIMEHEGGEKGRLFLWLMFCFIIFLARDFLNQHSI